MYSKVHDNNDDSGDGGGGDRKSLYVEIVV